MRQSLLLFRSLVCFHSRFQRINSSGMISFSRDPGQRHAFPCSQGLGSRRVDIFGGERSAHCDFLPRNTASVHAGWVLGDKTFAVVAGGDGAFG